MMGGRGRFHHVDSRSLEDGVVGGLDFKDTELGDDVERICADWKLDCAEGNGLRSRQNRGGVTGSGE